MTSIHYLLLIGTLAALYALWAINPGEQPARPYPPAVAPTAHAPASPAAVSRARA